MQSWTLIATIVSLIDLAAASGTVSIYNIDDPMFGTCRLKGISASSDNFKLYASVSNKDFVPNEACARCITVKRADDPTKTVSAYVLDICDGCAKGTLQLSGDAMTALDIAQTDTTTRVSYTFDTCPASLMSGDIKACLMEGGSSTYVPLQFYNSQKVITGATIDGVAAKKMSSSFLYSANPGSPSTSWYKSVDFTVTSADGETLNGNFAFANTSGCATSDVQFYSPSAPGGANGSTGGSSGAIIGAICGVIGALLIIVGLIFLVRRRKRGKFLDGTENDVENQYLSPTSKPKAALAATFRSDHNDHQPLASPTADYAETFSPDTKVKVPGSQMQNVGSHVSSPVIAAAVPGTAVAVSVAVDSLGSSDPSSAASAPNPREVSVKRSPSPKPGNAVPTFAFSNNMTTSPHSLTVLNAKDAPTLTAPVVPTQSLRTGFYDDDAEEERSSFDIDDMRETEARATSTRPMDSQPSFTPYMSAGSYANTMTSPQGNSHATSLRRPSSKQRTSGRESGQYNNGRSNHSPAQDDLLSARSSHLTNADSTTDLPLRDSDASFPALQNTDSSTSQHSLGSTRESGGYSRESLNILGYPYSKKSGRHHNLTG
ncbi:hypothetical protein KXD40_005075 [Peronospora effusa]|uniref:Expansin-like EG45 domain-containing protein n=1 Tax=Peronospora effusa TaxID=542832 RepID=A0A3M6VJK3_9STRA|nr:hypothetical protein DD238_002716 [Peronospora effusa]RQM16849.1 hypothetical protein DD237_003431 [Peronospora effusa]UIZ22373.1 hypothetical protein KXD40_005075 [Peronospora effusa]